MTEMENQVEKMEREALIAELAKVISPGVMRDVVPACTTEQLRKTVQGCRDGLARHAALGFEEMQQ